jgi:hypothetical protein
LRGDRSSSCDRDEQSIEHLARPNLALANINSLLMPGVLLVVSTGDYGSLLRKLTGQRWRLFSDRTRRFFLTEKTRGGLLRAPPSCRDFCDLNPWLERSSRFAARAANRSTARF